jgi:hypothetical protein
MLVSGPRGPENPPLLGTLGVQLPLPAPQLISVFSTLYFSRVSSQKAAADRVETSQRSKSVVIPATVALQTLKWQLRINRYLNPILRPGAELSASKSVSAPLLTGGKCCWPVQPANVLH